MNQQALNADQASVRKRKRLSTACDRCRSRKVRCDDRQPICSKCLEAGAECVTRNPRQPHVPVQRREAQSQSLAVASPKNTGSKEIRKSPSSHANHYTEFYSEASPVAVDLLDTRRPPSVSRSANGALFSGPLPSIPRFISGNCLFVLTQWLDLAFARLGLPERFSWEYRANKLKPGGYSPQGADYSRNEPIICDKNESRLSLEHFTATVNLVFPVIDQNDAMPTGLNTSTDDDTTILGLFRQLVLAAGFTMTQDEETDKTSRILDSALSNLVMLMQDESIHSVNAFILMGLLFRGRNDSEMAWRMLAIAVPKAQALGLDRRFPVQAHPKPTGTWHRQEVNTWWSLFILDKVLSIELQRPPMIRDCFCDQELPSTPKQGQQMDAIQSCFCALIQLAKIQGHVCERLLACTQAEELGQISLDQVIQNKLRASGELDQLLAEWVEHLPFQFRPSEYPSCDPKVLPAVAFMAVQYYQTLFLIHRNALIINPTAIKTEIEAHFANEQWRHRALNGSSICGNVARSIVNVLNHVVENNISSLLNSVYASLISVYTLAIQIVKNPTGESARADLEIQASAIRIIERSNFEFKSRNYTINKTVNALHSQVKSRIRGQNYFHGQQIAPSSSEGAGESIFLSLFPARPLDPSSQAQNNSGTEASTSQGMENHFNEDSFVSMNSAWNGPGVDLDVFDNAMDLNGFDWNAFARTLDLPS